MKAQICRQFLVVLLALFTVPTFADGAFSPATACTYYASPTGRGNGLSPTSPFQISKFWSVAKPGMTLCLTDGVYTGGNSTIAPPAGLSGTQANPITIKALNDGQVRLNGQGGRIPVRLYNNDWFVIEGINACCSSRSVFNMGTGSDNNVIRRAIGWDAADANTEIFGSHGNTGNLFEDVAGFGIARKIFAMSYGGNNVIIRRAWAQWERSTTIGPKMAYTLAYNNYNVICENCIGAWDETSMGGEGVNQPYGILAMDRFDGDAFANSKYLGSIAYIRAKDKAEYMIGLARSSSSVAGITYKDVVIYIEPGSHLNLKPFSLPNLRSDRGGPANNQLLANATEIGGAQSVIRGDWRVSSHVDVDSVSEAPSIWDGPGNDGARICKRYVNGVLTADPLWPWPMNQRIIDAMRESGRQPVDLTKTMEQMFGPIPSMCRSDMATTTPSSAATSVESLPSAPSNLRTDQ